jgi:hypothetical protein
MAVLSNENILSEIFSCLKLIQSKKVLLTAQNKIINKQIFKNCSYKAIFGSIGTSHTTLDNDEYIDFLDILPNGDMVSVYNFQTFSIYDLKLNKCVETFTIEQTISHMLALRNGILAIATSFDKGLKFIDPNNNFETIKTLSLDYHIDNMFRLSNGSLFIVTCQFSYVYNKNNYFYEIIDYGNDYQHIIKEDGVRLNALTNLSNNNSFIAASNCILLAINISDNYSSVVIKTHTKYFTALIHKDNKLITGSSDYPFDHSIEIWGDIGKDIKCIKTITLTSQIYCLLKLPVK